MATTSRKGPHPAPPVPATGDPGLRRYCTQPLQVPRQFAPNVSANRVFAIIALGKKWVAGTQITYFCFKAGDPVPSAWHGKAADLEAVDAAFQSWVDLGIGLNFKKVTHPGDAMVRIGFDPDEGSWSYVGRNILNTRDPLLRTMNFGWPLTTPYGRDTALHEIGHTLALEHEHQNPYAGIVWNREAILDYFRGPPNFWDETQIEWNILRKLSPTEVKGTVWDPDSVMEYAFPPGLIQKPVEYYTAGLTPKGGLSAADVAWVRKSYPLIEASAVSMLELGLSQLLQLKAGETRLFEFTPPRSRTYHIGTFGVSDTVLVLFEVTPGGNVQIAGDDDSGTDLNAQISMHLQKDRRYQIGVRMFHAEAAMETSLLVW